MQHLKNSIGNMKNISLDQVCELITIVSTQDDLGQFVKSEFTTSVFCSELSITRAEFTNAGQLGLKPSKLLIVDSDSYDNELFLKYLGIKYSIYKTFMRLDGFTELYVEVKAGD
jgi:SPP1 family predicted phage head-tail adaptor